MSAAADSYGAVAAALSEPRRQIETAFVAVGGRLADSAGVLGELAETFEKLPQDFESAELTEATARLEAVAVEAGRISGAFAEERELMRALAEAAAAASTPISDLQRKIKTIGIVAINARVTAASLPAGTEGVAVFTEDIAVLSNDAETTVRDFAGLYSRLLGNLRRAGDERGRFEAAHESTLAELATRIGARLEAVAVRRRESGAASLETARMSRRIAEQVSAAVFGLQVGDNTRQRLEHIEAALERIDALDGASAGRSGTARQVCELVAAQLADTVDSFDRDVSLARRSLVDLAADAGEMIRQSLGLYGGASDGGQSPVAALSAELRAAAAILNDCETQRSRLDTLAGEAVAAIRGLLEHVDAVRAIEGKMRLLSLNATVQCARLGPSGRALSAIAEQIRGLTVETAEASEQAVRTLERTGELARKVAEAGAADSADKVGQLETDALSAVTLLETVDGRLGAALTRLETEGPRVASLLANAAEGFAGQSDVAAGLAEVQAMIETRRAVLADAPPPGAEADALLADLRALYTMESERIVHDRLLGVEPEAAAPTNEPAGADDDDLDAMFL